MPGHQVSMFKAFNQDWLCSICLEAFRNPVKFPCGHHMCLDCFNSFFPLIDAEKHCPECRASIDKSAVVHDLALESEIDNAFVFCTHRDFGCDANIRLAEFSNHSTTCMCKPQQCQDCGYIASSLSTHTYRDCIDSFKLLLDVKNSQLKAAENLAEQRRGEVLTALHEKELAVVNSTIVEREAQITLESQQRAEQQRDRMVDLTVEQDITIKEYEEDILFYSRQNDVMLQSLQLKDAHIRDLERRLGRYTGRPTPYGGSRPARHIINISPEPHIVDPDRVIPSPAYSFSDAGDESMYTVGMSRT